MESEKTPTIPEILEEQVKVVDKSVVPTFKAGKSTSNPNAAPSPNYNKVLAGLLFLMTMAFLSLLGYVLFGDNSCSTNNKSTSGITGATPDNEPEPPLRFGQPDGKGGLAFDAGWNPRGVDRVTVRAGMFVDGIALHYRDGTETGWFGGTGGDRHVFQLEFGDSIVSAKVWSGWGTDAIQFYTRNNVTSPKYGGDGGVMTEYKAEETSGGELVGMNGRVGSMLDRINFVFKPVNVFKPGN